MLGLASMALLAVVGLVAGYGVYRASAVTRGGLTVLPFLSGHRPQEHGLSRFHARYYPLTLLFLAFDIEMLYMYPWATVVAQVGTSAVVEMFVFLAVLMLGVVWAWREGALQWT
jgi:NADH:ubiquinone oxidoreductase subunit 3 (subunit A)